MKCSIKLSLAFVFSICLFLSCSLLFLDAKADTTLQKISLTSDRIRIQTDAGVPLVDVQLLENTDQCLTDCHAVIRIHPYQDIILPDKPDSEFAWRFEKSEPWMDDLVSYHFEILETTEYKVRIPEYGKAIVNKTCYREDNSTYKCEVKQTIQTGSHEETISTDGYKPFTFWGETLKADQDYTIKLVGVKRAQLGENNIDWIPTIKGVEINDWQWWNSSWQYRQEVNLTDMAKSDNQTNWVMRIELDSTKVGPHFNWNDDRENIRFTNSTGGKLLYYIERWDPAGKAATIVIKFDKLVNNTENAYYMYYNLTGGPTPSENTTDAYFLYDDFSAAVLNVSKWNVYNEGVTVCALNTTTKKFRMYSAGSLLDCRLQYNSSASGDLPNGIRIETNVSHDANVSGDFQKLAGFWGAYGLSNTTVKWNSHSGDAAALIGYWYEDNITDGNELGNFTIITLSNINTSSQVIIYKSGTVKGADNSTRSQLNFSYYALPGSGDIVDFSIDDIRILRYDEMMPMVEYGAEETPSCPSDDTYISQYTEFEPSNKYCEVSDGGAQGVLIINAPNIVVDCNGMTLNGTGSGVGIYNRGFHNVTLQNCKVQNYASDVKFDNDLVAEVISAASAYG